MSGFPQRPSVCGVDKWAVRALDTPIRSTVPRIGIVENSPTWECLTCEIDPLRRWFGDHTRFHRPGSGTGDGSERGTMPRARKLGVDFYAVQSYVQVHELILPLLHHKRPKFPFLNSVGRHMHAIRRKDGPEDVQHRKGLRLACRSL
jgi:hypothetical protein